MLTIRKVILNTGDAVVHVYGTHPVSSALGTQSQEFYARLDERVAPLNTASWGNDELRAAVAAHLGVAITDVEVAPPPVPPALPGAEGSAGE